MKTDILLPHPARIIRIVPMVKDNHLFQVRFEDEDYAYNFKHIPGQFMEVSIIGTGEMPISISSSPTRKGILEFCVRRVGRVTNALYRLEHNSLIGLRGPYGNGFPIETMKGNNLLIIAGGLGMAPLRSLLWYAIDNRKDFKDITLMYGSKNPGEVLFKTELITLLERNDINCLLTVDNNTNGNWKGHTGVVTTLFEKVDLDASTTYAAVCGPPVVYRFVLEKLLEKKFSKGRILMSLERKMKCGVGKCGHCGVGSANKYVCIDGPIFTYWDVINLREII
jgi:sulfhydrogenase subunit gamma (sulfur reductase)